MSRKLAEAKIGVRELKNRATAIVRSVREDDAEYVITLNGEPVAILRPLTAEDRRRLAERRTSDSLAAIDMLAAKVAQAWTSPQSAVELISEQRR